MICGKGSEGIMVPACTTPVIGNGFLLNLISSGKRAVPPCTLFSNAPQVVVISYETKTDTGANFLKRVF
jgi:hypothetical protein